MGLKPDIKSPWKFLTKVFHFFIAGFCHGYNSKSHVKEYDKDCLQNEILLISNRTGFQLSYLYSCVLQVLFSNATMDSLSHIYNEMHDTDEATDDTDPTKMHEQIDDNENEVEGDVKEDERGDEGQGDGEEEADDEEEEEEEEKSDAKPSSKMDPRTMANAVYTFMLLDFQKRWDIPIKFGKTMTKTIRNNVSNLKLCFEKTYSQHSCSKPGCSHPNKTLIADGNLKSTRLLCGAEIAGIDKFETTGASVMTGCKNVPIIGRRFCKLHENKTPHISHKKLSKESLTALRDPKFPIKAEGKSAGLFTIAGIHDKKVEKVKENSKKGKKKKNQNTADTERFYLLSWENCPGLKTWEPASIVPMFIINLYEKNGESQVPKPKVKETTSMMNGVEHTSLTWEENDKLKEFQGNYVLPEEEYDRLDSERVSGKLCSSRRRIRPIRC